MMHVWVTDHAVRRWLERAEGWDFARLPAARRGAPDAQVLGEAASTLGVDVEAARRRVLDDVARAAIRAGAKAIRRGAVQLIVIGGAVVTCRPVRRPAERISRACAGRGEVRRGAQRRRADALAD
jgi:hypothetical protein